MDVMFYINLIMYLITFIALVYGIYVIISVKGDIDEVLEE